MSEKDEPLRWRPEPNKDGRNSLGLKNHEIHEKKDQFRILFLGDSLLWCGETSSGQMYTEIVEQRLNAVQVLGRPVEVINAGICGYTTYQESEFLKIYGLDMKPDLVFLCLVFNDVYFKYLHRPVMGDSGLGFSGADPEIFLHRFDAQSFWGSLFSKSHLAHECVYLSSRIIGKFQKEVLKTDVNLFESRTDFYLAWKGYGWRETSRLIREMKEILTKRNVGFAVIVFPVSEQMDDEKLRKNKEYMLFPQRKIQEICDKYEIPVLDLTGALSQGGGKTLFSDYLHLTGAGNDIVAKELGSYLEGYLSRHLEELKVN